MSDQPKEERTIGPQEKAVLDKFEQIGWRPVSFEQLGPDGTETLAVLLFHLCPVCTAVVPLGSEEDPLPDLHRDWHLGEAQALDEAVVALKILLSKAGFPQGEQG